MPPASIIILRHGHRVDHFDPSWRKTAPRPHDSPLNDEGLQAAKKAGTFAFHHLQAAIKKLNKSDATTLMLNPQDVVILSSPMIRTIQTSSQFASGFESGFASSTKSSSSSTSSTSIPVHLETAMIEPHFWITYDIQKAGFSHEKPYQGFVYHDAKHLNENVSPRVVIGDGEKKKNFDEQEEEKETAKHATTEGQQQHSSLFVVSHLPDATTGGFKQTMDDNVRFASAAKKLLFQSPHLDGKHVVLVGHGASTVQMYNAIFRTNLVDAKEEFDASPDYTGMAMLLFDAENQVYRHLCDPFTTPHDE